MPAGWRLILARGAAGVFVVFLFFFQAVGFFFVADFVFLRDLGPAVVQRLFGEERVGHAGVVVAGVEEDLVNLDAVALAGDLKRRLDSVEGMEVRIVFDFAGFEARGRIARFDRFADRQVRIVGEGEAGGGGGGYGQAG